MTGTMACIAGQLLCAQNVESDPEVCDGLDNDCDGVADNGVPGEGNSCSTGLLGACAAGMTVCVGGSLICAPVM